MSIDKESSEVTYEVEEAAPAKSKGFLKSRAAKISAITVGSALALAAAFGVGVVAGEKIAGNGSGSFSQGGQFGPGQGFGDGDHRPPGGPDDGNDHGGFQMPNNTAPVNPSPVPTTTP